MIPNRNFSYIYCILLYILYFNFIIRKIWAFCNSHSHTGLYPQTSTAKYTLTSVRGYPKIAKVTPFNQTQIRLQKINCNMINPFLTLLYNFDILKQLLFLNLFSSIPGKEQFYVHKNYICVVFF